MGWVVGLEVEVPACVCGLSVDSDDLFPNLLILLVYEIEMHCSPTVVVQD